MDAKARVRVATDVDIVSARQEGRRIASELRFSSSDLTVIAAAISELARSIVAYAGRGEVEIDLVQKNGRRGVSVEARDQGPGIADIALALRDGYSTSGSLGLGLPGARRLMDEFTIVSAPGEGTIVTLRKWSGNVALPSMMSLASVDAGVAVRALSGQARCGDLHVIHPRPNGVLVAVIDGLGHGPGAADAAERAAAVLQEQADRPIVAIAEACHDALGHTRGVVMSAATLDAGRDTLSWLSIGNTEGVLVRAAGDGRRGREALLARSGVVGAVMPQLRATVYHIAPGDLLVCATDGIRPEFATALRTDLGPQELADRILDRYARPNDDALVLVVRYLGAPPESA